MVLSLDLLGAAEACDEYRSFTSYCPEARAQLVKLLRDD